MERLSIHDAGFPPGGPPNPNQHGPPPSQMMQPPPGPPAVPQLPPQMFTTAAQLLDLTDKKLMVVLRDGRKLLGVLRSWDQFGNLFLQDTVERLFVEAKEKGGECLYADIERGSFLVRGENVSLLGEIDLDKDDYIPPPFQEGSVEKVFHLKQAQDAATKQKDKKRAKKLAALGFEGEHSGEAII